MSIVFIGVVLALGGCVGNSAKEDGNNPQGDSHAPDEEQDPLFAIVDSDGLWGFMDKTGKVVIEPQFTFATPFHEGLATVTFDDPSHSTNYDVDKYEDDYNIYNYGFIDKTGKMVIEPQFAYGGYFSNGLASVLIYDDSDSDIMHSAYIDKTGKIIWQGQIKALLW